MPLSRYWDSDERSGLSGWLVGYTRNDGTVRSGEDRALLIARTKLRI